MSAPAATIATLDAISRTRALTDWESRLLEIAIKNEQRINGTKNYIHRPWTQVEDDLLKVWSDRSLPYEQMARNLDRTTAAVTVRLNKKRRDARAEELARVLKERGVISS